VPRGAFLFTNLNNNGGNGMVCLTLELGAWPPEQ
jgi:hypothetical protein